MCLLIFFYYCFKTMNIFMIVTLNGSYQETALTPNFSVLFSTSQSFRFLCMLTIYIFFSALGHIFFLLHMTV